MIVTVTPSPSIDWTVHVDSFEFGAVNRVANKTREPSGKGINVSAALHREGIPTTAVFPAGGESGRFLINELREQGIPHIEVDSLVDVRTNITLIVPDHAGTKINETGHALLADVFHRLLEACSYALEQATYGNSKQPMLAICGSVPPGAPDDFYRRLLTLGHRHNAVTIVDASQQILRTAIAERPDLIKPNVSELAEESGMTVRSLGDVVAAAQSLRSRGAGAVLASLGADGMMLIDQNGALHGCIQGVEAVNTVGAGDAALAGYLSGLASGEGRIGCVERALVFASSAVTCPTTLFEVDPTLRHRTLISASFDPEQRLTEVANHEPGRLPTTLQDFDTIPPEFL